MPRNDIPPDDMAFIRDRIRRDKPIAARRVGALLDRLDLAERIIGRARMWQAHDERLTALIKEWEEGV
jgi:hypothetical protein